MKPNGLLAAASLVKVTGIAQVGEENVTRPAQAAAAGNLLPRGPEGNLVSELLVTSMMKPREIIRIRLRCRVCGRPRAVYRKFGICRICFRNLASDGLIPGVKKASW